METELERLRRMRDKAAEELDWMERRVANEEKAARRAAERERAAAAEAAWPQEGDKCWLIDATGKPAHWSPYIAEDKCILDAGLLFKTEAEAQREADAQSAWRKLRRAGLWFAGFTVMPTCTWGDSDREAVRTAWSSLTSAERASVGAG